MIKRLGKLAAAFLLFVFCSQAIVGQTTVRVLFIFDASFSMYDKWDKTPKIDYAKKALVALVDSMRTIPNLQMALRTLGADYPLYPHRNCEDTRLVVPFSANNGFDIESQIKAIEPKGTTPIAYTLTKCADDFTKCANCRNLIVLITDGVEECGGDICEAAKTLQQKGVTLKPFIIGIGKENFGSAYDCVGKFFDVKQEDDFKNILNVVVSQALNNTTAQVNLLDEEGRATETDVAMSFYDESTGKCLYNLMHTINDSGNPDTISLDPNTTYHLVVHTTPEVDKHNITLVPGKHNIIAVKAPQGFLHIVMDVDNEYKALFAIVRKADDMQTLNVQPVESTDKYLVGKYDLEIMTLPRMIVKGVTVSESSTTTVNVPQGGEVSISKQNVGPTSLYQDVNGKMVWVCNLITNQLMQNIVLQPGKYHVIFRSANSKETIYTVDKVFTVTAGSSVSVSF